VSWIRNVPIGRKLTWAFAIVSGGALLIATAIELATDWLEARQTAADELLVVAELIGASSTAAIVFRDEAAATEILQTLKAIPDLGQAVLYDHQGQVLARYGRNADERLHTFQMPILAGPGHHFDHGHLTVTHPIALQDRRIGVVVLHSDLASRYAALRRGALYTVALVVVVFFTALLLATRLQRLISVPILRLVELTEQVSREGNYGLRAAVEGRDEIGQLASGVNDMLETVQHRDGELAAHQRQLESEVAERTADLARTNERLKAELHERERTEAQLKQAHAELERHHRETELLSELNDRLQLCHDVAETAPVIALYGARLFPGASGSVSLFTGERTLLEPMVDWGEQTGGGAFGRDECWALRQGRLHAVSEPGQGLLCRHLREPPPPGGYLCVPMIAQGNMVGLLHLRFDRTPASGERPPALACERLAFHAAENVALAIANLRLRERLHEQSVRDPLTGLYNRRHMEESLEREIARARRESAPLAVVMLDLDHFKAYNDEHGHDGGDALLVALGKLLRRRVRAEDVACRFGGEEFMLIMPGANVDIARQRVEEILEAMRGLEVRQGGDRLDTTTISAGLAVFPEHGETAEALLGAADDALYAAKAAGRDRVEVYGATLETEPEAKP